jgi:hypothetical protein
LTDGSRWTRHQLGCGMREDPHSGDMSMFHGERPHSIQTAPKPVRLPAPAAISLSGIDSARVGCLRCARACLAHRRGANSAVRNPASGNIGRNLCPSLAPHHVCRPHQIPFRAIIVAPGVATYGGVSKRTYTLWPNLQTYPGVSGQERCTLTRCNNKLSRMSSSR